MAYSEEVKEAAKGLLMRGVKPKEVARELGINSERVIYQWITKYGWDSFLYLDSLELSLSRAINGILEKKNPTTKDLSYLETLFKLMDRAQGIRHREEKHKVQLEKIKTEVSSSTRNSKGNSGKGKGGLKNDLSKVKQEDFDKIFDKLLTGYQKKLRKTKYNNKINRTRNILKSRRIGLTYYFALEAFECAVMHGDNQIFISASRHQAEVFLAYIRAFCFEYFGVTLTGGGNKPLILWNGAELHFLSNNPRTAQGRGGHFYFDEYFWTQGFKKIKDLVGASAVAEGNTRTFFSTPSTVEHEGYPFWSGEEWNKATGKEDKFTTGKKLHEGVLGPDGVYRKVIDIFDAANDGCDWLDIDRIKQEYPDKNVFNNLFGCQFIDPTNSVFSLSKLTKCLTKAANWDDYDAGNPLRPFGDREVYLGFDPSRTRDAACCVVISPPKPPETKYRVLELHKWINKNFSYQANRIKELTERFNVTYIGIDVTGIGFGVSELVKKFYPAVREIHYSLNTKAELVMKGKALVDGGNVEWDEDNKEIGSALLQIRQTVTSGDKVTYSATRTEKTGHADAGFALLNGVYKDQIGGPHGSKVELTFSKQAA